MTTKILHTGDLHLDAQFTFLGERGQEQRQELLATLDRIVKTALDEAVDLFLVAGDLFDSNSPSYNTIDRVVNAFKKLEQANIPICLIPGSHDSYGPQSIYHLYNFHEALSNLTIFTDTLNQKVFDRLDLTIYGKAVVGKGQQQNPVQNVVRTTDTAHHIALGHGTIGAQNDEPPEPGCLDDIKNSGMNYIALGHYHSCANYSQDSVKVFYCGSPDLLELRQKNHGYVALVTINQSGDVSIKPKRVGRCYFKSENILVDSIKDVSQIIDIIKQKAHPHIYFEARLTGFSSFNLLIDTETIEQELSRFFLKLRVVDATRLQLDEIPSGALPKNTVMGQFLALMKDEISRESAEERAQAEKALKLGVALLRGKTAINDH